MISIRLVLAAILFLTTRGNAQSTAKEAGSSLPFAIAQVRFERNVTDGDYEVVFEAKGGDEGLTELTVVSPDNRKVVHFSVSAATLGMRQFRFESPEPESYEMLKAAYPEGMYTFSGTTASGAKLKATALLNHTLLGTCSFVHPRGGANGVGAKDLTISWTPVANVSSYIIYLEQDESDITISARLRGSVNSFDVPNGFLLPGTEYTLGIGTVTAEGNTTIVETTFMTVE